MAIQTSSFFGIDINPFAVELAKVTLNIAKKIAFDERREIAADLVGQMELDVDPSLPLDNLEKNIANGYRSRSRCATWRGCLRAADSITTRLI